MTPLKKAAAVLILSFCAHLFAAQPAEVIFLAGKGTVTEGMTAKIIEKGMRISADAVIKLEKKSVLTVGIGGSTWTIRSDKPVRLSSITVSKPDSSPSPLLRIFEKTRTLSRTTVLAVRAEKSPDAPEIVWADEDTKPSSDGGEAERYAKLAGMLNAGDYSGAARFYANSRNAFGARSADAAYSAGLSSFYLCRYDDAIAILKPLCDGAQDQLVRENALFYTAFSLHSLSDYAGSNAFLERFFRTGTKGPSAPYAYYIRGLNYGALGNGEEAQRCFRTIVDTWPSDPIAADAAECLTK